MLGRAASRLASARSAGAAAAAAVSRGGAAAAAVRPPAAAAALPPPFRRRRHATMSGAAAAEQQQPATAAAAAATPAEEQEEEEPALQLVQYVILRRDLWRAPLSWPLGPVVAQGAHAATAALSRALASGCGHAQRYVAPENLGSMRKVVLEVEDERRLRALAGRLAEAGAGYWLWVEQPEGVATALATWPAPRGEVAPYGKKGRLCRAGVGGGGQEG